MTARYSIIPATAFCDPRLSPADIKVLGIIGFHLNADNEAWPSQGRIAELGRLDRKTVNRALHKLVEFGYVRTRKWRPGKMRSVLVYKVEMNEDVRVPTPEDQPDLFPATDVKAAKSPTNADGAIFPTPTKNPTTADGAIFPTAQNGAETPPPSVPQLCPKGLGHSYAPRKSPTGSSPSSASDEAGLSADDRDLEIIAQPTSGELKASMVFNTGRVLLTGQGVSKRNAGSFLGKLVRDYGLDATWAAVNAAAQKPPVDGLTWLRKAAEGEARKRGRKIPASADDIATATEWDDHVRRYLRTGSWPKELGPRPDEIGYRGPLAPLEAIMANGRVGDLNVEYIRINIERLRVHQATDRKTS